MINKFKQGYKKQVFQPKWWSVFFNSFYFSRKGLYEGVSKFSDHLSGTMLDIGCGSKPYKDIVRVENYIGVDIAVSGHDHRGAESEVDYYYDGKVLPFEDQYFDSALSSEVFEHIFNLEDILLEINRVLKQNGKILITIPFTWDQHEEPYDYARYTEFGIKHLLEKHGFEIIEYKKSTTTIETLAQLFGSYVYKSRWSWNNKYLSRLLHIVFVAPLFLLTLLANKVLPDNGNLFLNHIILAKKL